MKHSYLDLYREGTSLLHRLDARAKLLATLAFVLAVSLLPLGGDAVWPAWPAYLALAALALAAAVVAGVPLRVALGRSLVAVPFALVGAASLPFLRAGTPLLTLALGPWRLTATAEGCAALAAALAKAWLSVLAAGLLTATTPFAELMAGLQALGLPELLAALMSFLYRYLYVLVDEAERLDRARASRSAGRRGGALAWRAQVLGGMVGSLFVRSYERSERIYQAMLARGFDGRIRSQRPAVSGQRSAISAGAPACPSPSGDSATDSRACSLAPEGERVRPALSAGEGVRGDSVSLRASERADGASPPPAGGRSCESSPAPSPFEGEGKASLLPAAEPSAEERERHGTPILRVQRLSFAYPDGRPVLHEIDLAVAEGERVALTGPNGAGKSTLLLHLNGILRGNGRITVAGLELGEHTLAQVRRLVGLVFQDPDDQLFSPTVFDDVAFGPLYMGLERAEVQKRVEQALAAVGAAGYERRMPHHMSLGERKRAAIATVLAMQARILVLDEPSSGLDPRGRRALIELLRTLPQTMIIASHDMLLVRELCPRTVILDGGRIAADGPTPQMLADRALLEAHGLEMP